MGWSGHPDSWVSQGYPQGNLRCYRHMCCSWQLRMWKREALEACVEVVFQTWFWYISTLFQNSQRMLVHGCLWYLTLQSLVLSLHSSSHLLSLGMIRETGRNNTYFTFSSLMKNGQLVFWGRVRACIARAEGVRPGGLGSINSMVSPYC